jgi:Tol biopolymer transport system component
MRLTTALGAALAAALVAAAPAWATFPGSNGRIAFSSNRSGDVEVYTVNPDGSDLQRLTNAPGEDSALRWSADGRRIVFASHRDGQSEIYVMNADGSDQTRLTNNPANDTFPAWSPDGSKIVFASERASNTTEIYAMNADGSDVTRLTTTPFISGTEAGFSDFPLWSADDRIAFSSVRSGLQTLQLFTMAPDGSNQKQITSDPVGALYPIWSPDSNRLLYYSEHGFDTGGQNGDVFVVNADGTGTAQLTNTPGADLAASWSPDGTKILFSTDRNGGQLDLYTMNADGSGQTPLTSEPTGEAGGDWGPVPLPAPKIGETVNVAVVSGTVLVKTRGSSKFTDLAQARQIKVGAQLDTTRGVVHMATAAGKGKTQSGDFGQGVFEVAQSKAAKGLTDLKLKGGKFGSCGGSKANAAAKKKTIRSLFSKAKGKFRTKGRYSAATVRGTTWLVTDRCDGTLTSVKSGTVSVFDFKRHKTVKVKAGKSYLARAR